MENIKIKCSSKKHKESIDAEIYCHQCQIYMCNKCLNYHSGLFENHYLYKLEGDKDKIFSGFCKIGNHINKLEYFCKSHNQLCCVACISKIKDKNNGQHSECNICSIESIKEDKKNIFHKNISYLENISQNIEDTINKLKILFEKINKDKEKLKLNIQNIFTKIRNKLNEREDELLLKVDKQFDNLYFKEELIKTSEALPKKIKISLENGTKINNDWNDKEKIISLINECLNIEISIKYINEINENINKFNNIKKDIKFIPEDNQINYFLEQIISFGNIICFDNNKEYNINDLETLIDEFELQEEKLKLELEKKKIKNLKFLKF